MVETVIKSEFRFYQHTLRIGRLAADPDVGSCEFARLSQVKFQTPCDLDISIARQSEFLGVGLELPPINRQMNFLDVTASDR